MKNTKRTLTVAFATLMMGSMMVWADSSPTTGNPETNASDKNYDTNQPNSVPGGIEKSKDAANRGLNHVDNGVHKAINKTKKGAHKAKAKTESVADKLSEPAVKPAN